MNGRPAGDCFSRCVCELSGEPYLRSDWPDLPDESQGAWLAYQEELAAFLQREGFPQALGSGSELAIGAMEALMSGGSPVVLPAQEIVVRAVRIAMKRDAGTGGKIMLALRGAENFGPGRI